MSTIDITVAEPKSSPTKVSTLPLRTVNVAPITTGFYVGSTFIADSMPPASRNASHPAEPGKSAH
jgi:hypothetical protein